MRVLLTDIEGTTTPISFVKDVLFPYCSANVEQFLQDHWEDDEIQESYIKPLIVLLKELDYSLHSQLEENVQYIRQISEGVQDLIQKDLKLGPLKLLQGLIWRSGYENGALKSIVYEDVVDAFKSLQQRGILIHIYSSGSVEAQKLLFKYSNRGDLTRFISGYYDTNIGHKREVSSYNRILEQLQQNFDGQLDAQDVTFLTDILEEAEAAQKAGMKAVIMVRPGNYQIDPAKVQQFKCSETFQQALDMNM
ncbi:hypothetical protein MIR68_001808 [Amoeboaphelidium protococcarum]|nr:hypothetical protein MIR68_001808 [Amoeboaphelidium protococcarum]